MQHLGDITKISGYTAPIVDCIIGGSPCQDLSVAGKRAGLDGERSGLYMEQLRIVKELRENDRHNGRSGVDVRPRYMVWENVPGAFSSNKAEDFRIVLEELAKIADEDAVIPMPPKGKWTNCGCIMGDGWSVAWRVFDAQFWGVPQRRRRIALVADFGGQSAPEILFVRESVSGDINESEPKREETSRNASGSVGATDCERNGVVDRIVLDDQGGQQISVRFDGKAPTLRAETHGNLPCVIYKSATFEPGISSREEGHFYEGISGTLRANAGDNAMSVVYSVDQGGGKSACNISEERSPTLTCTHGGEPAVCYSIQGNMIGRAGKNGPQGDGVAALVYQDKVGALCARDFKGVGSQYVEEDKLVVALSEACYWDGTQTVGTLTANNAGGNQRMPDKENFNCVIERKQRYIVRRLTPLECERLQGYPDGWTDIGEWTDSKGKVHKASDAARYKALGNSIALPPWKWVLKRLCACYERDATMASLFDGIGGFPYLWEQLNGKGSCLWASEIEEFPMAVTKVRIGE